MKLQKISLFIFSVFYLFQILSFTFAGEADTSTVAEKVKHEYTENIERFKQSAITLMKVIEENKPQSEIKTAFLKCRNNFKRIEILSEYSDPSFMKQFNGPNLPKLDDNFLNLTIIEPQGLQAIEELIFSDSPMEEKNKILSLLKNIEGNINTLKANSTHLHLSDRNIFEACRQELVRVTTLGLTGFDAPVSKHALPEAAIAMQSVYDIINGYFPALQKKDKAVCDSLQQILSESVNFLNVHKDFDSFDRFRFFTKYISPAYRLILHTQKALNIETSEINGFNTAVNYSAENIFDEDFLNPYYYNRSKKDKVNPNSVYLGKLLFFDPIFSENNKRSCASCHKPDKGFADELPKSLAFNFEGNVGRNSPTLLNAVYQGSYFYDMRAKFPEEQIDHVVYNHKEFKSNFETIITRLKSSPEYVQLFRKAFPDMPETAIDGFTISKSLADYVRSLTALNSPFDRYVRGETNNIDEGVIKGYNLFMGKAQCGTCHFAPVFNGTVPPLYHETETEVLGVPSDNDTVNFTLDSDLGRYHFRNSPIYRHSFKTPTVRNASLTAPYMHNGAFRNLEEVMRFYNKGGGAGMGMNVPNQTLPSDPLNLTAAEIKDIISFINALTDTTSVNGAPEKLPLFPGDKVLNSRKVGGEY